jgi:hypothetical protein
MRSFLIFLVFVSPLEIFAQELVFPGGTNWYQLEEGKTLSFQLALTENMHNVKFSLEGGAAFGMEMDSAGHFSWTPSFDLMNRLEKRKEVSVIFQAEWSAGKRLRHPVNFMVII